MNAPERATATLWDESRADRPGHDVEQHQPDTGQKLRREEAAEHDPVRAACRRDEDQRCREEKAPEDEGRADAHPPGDACGDERASDRADRCCAEHDAERRRADVQAARCVEHEEREEHEVEEVQRRDSEQLGADDRVVPDPPRTRHQPAVLP